MPEEMLDVAPTLPRFGADAEAALLQGRRPGLGEYLGAAVGEGWWNTTVATARAAMGASQEGVADPRPISRDEWRYHPLWRPGVEWDGRMTEGRAAAIARTYDENAYRRAVQGARDAGALEAVLGFGGMMVGGAPDPVNWLPIAGPLGRVARAGAALEARAGSALAARALTGAATVLERPGIGGAALRGSVDALGGNLLAAPLVYGVHAQFGDEVTFDGVLADLAAGALLGAGLGAAGGAIHRMLDRRAAVRTVDAAARDLAAGRPTEVPGQIAAQAVEDAAVRAAPPEARALMPDGGDVRLADLPTRPDGAPLTREEFDARVAPERPADPLDARIQDAYLRATGGEYAKSVTLADLRDLLPNVPRAELDRALTDMAGTGRGTLHPFDDPMREIPGRGGGQARVDAARLHIGPGIHRDMIWLDAPLSERPGTDAAYAWYREAMGARQQAERLRATAPRPDPAAAAGAPRDAAREGGAAAGGEGRAGEADPEAEAAAAAVQTMRAEGRIRPGDEAVLRAGDEAAQELEAVAKGLEQAAACTLRVMA